MHISKIFNSSIAGILISLSLFFNFLKDFVSTTRELDPTPKSLITIGSGSSLPGLDSLDGWLTSKPMLIILMILSAFAFTINVVELYRKYKSDRKF